jgi:hypothetical protein
MLDALGVADLLGITSIGSLFEDRTGLLHTTSAIRYPGICEWQELHRSSTASARSAILTAFVEERLGAELARVDGALVVPLGESVERCLDRLVTRGDLDRDRCLFDFLTLQVPMAIAFGSSRSDKLILSSRCAPGSAELYLRCSRPRVAGHRRLGASAVSRATRCRRNRQSELLVRPYYALIDCERGPVTVRLPGVPRHYGGQSRCGDSGSAGRGRYVSPVAVSRAALCRGLCICRATARAGRASTARLAAAPEPLTIHHSRDGFRQD